ncbi:dihydropteroate synthase [Desulfuribacillus alkaliarsenatis]|uniref:Dihydropteroate synthase n=2 Tax=Desulfuribacillus alkaliarsenatis TaxID=766136 RepID=A0A1E5FZ11_9FIRM|nr:dihydropteroate synthase [Desulfuribacillus alkaliarsenatis]
MLTFQNRQELASMMEQIGADAPGVQIMKQKGEFFHVYVSNVNLRAANIMKQEMLSKGGEACLHMGVSKLELESSDVILFGSRRIFKKIIANFSFQPFGLKRISKELKEMFDAYDRSQNLNEIPEWCKHMNIPLKKRTIIMGILNVTPDSFSDGGSYTTVELAVRRAKEMVAEGADIIDIGGESTRPGALPVNLEAELVRVLPIVKAVAKEIQTPISVDTYKAEVAEAAVKEGAKIINDVWGAKKQPEIAKVAAKYKVPIILMHNRDNKEYKNLVGEMIQDLRESIDIAQNAGVINDYIILDPGIGFAKEYEHNLEVMYRLRDICKLGYPVLLGTSRKSLIAKTLDLPVNERVEGTAATVALGIERGVDIVRVHEVKEMQRVCRMMDAMVRR